MIEERLPRENFSDREGALIYADIVSRSLYLIVDQLGSHADLAKKIIEDANTRLPSYRFEGKTESSGFSSMCYFRFKSQQDEYEDIVFSLGVAPIRDPLIVMQTIKEIDGKRYQTDRSLFIDRLGKLLMSFWQASWEPKNKKSMPQAIHVNFDGKGLPILMAGTNQQRISREQAFANFGPY